MRRIYLNNKPVRMDMRCGLTPMVDCPILVWAKQNGMFSKKDRDIFFRYVAIYLKTNPSKFSVVTKQIQEICDGCKYGEMGIIKQNTR